MTIALDHSYVFSWFVVIEHGTVLETCAIDALLTVEKRDGDYWTYITTDKAAWDDFENFKIGRRKAIMKEFMDRYS